MALATTGGILSIILITLQGCAMTNATTADDFRNTLTVIPAADPVLDHYIAWVPLKQAQTAGVARAMTHISLGNAREQVAEELCGDHHVIKQPVTDSVGPVQTLAPAAAGAGPHRRRARTRRGITVSVKRRGLVAAQIPTVSYFVRQ